MKPLEEKDKSLLTEAVSYASVNEYQIAIIYLEELLDKLQYSDEQASNFDTNALPVNYNNQAFPQPVHNSFGFRLSAITGIDYNRQEFELSYFESDSAVLEQISRPYIGFAAGFIYQFNPVYSIEISNSLRYDNDYLRNDYRILWRAGSLIAMQYSGYWNQSESIFTSSFWEHELNARFNNRITPSFSLSIENNFRHKTYRSSSIFIADYFRNRFISVAQWPMFRMEYNNELNESLGSEDLDYLQHLLRFGLRNTPNARLMFNLDMDLSLRKYTLAFEDSTLNNLYKQAGFNIYLTVPLADWMKLVSEDNLIYKAYVEKSSLEPDYFWNFFRPGLVVNFTTDFELVLGYEWEFRTHRSVSNDIFNVSEQNYNSNGFFLSLSYLNSPGSYLSASVSYQWRRYPQSATNDIISIYSNRNVLSVTAMIYLPLMSNLFLNTYIMYDNDQDIEIDQQSNQSTIFTTELEYKF
jgi:hypothetical protein